MSWLSDRYSDDLYQFIASDPLVPVYDENQNVLEFQASQSEDTLIDEASTKERGA